MGVNKSRTLPKKRMFIFCSSTAWDLGGGAYRLDISAQGQTINLYMTGKFILCLSDNCCLYERLSPGRSKTYVTFDIAEESCT